MNVSSRLTQGYISKQGYPAFVFRTLALDNSKRLLLFSVTIKKKKTFVVTTKNIKTFCCCQVLMLEMQGQGNLVYVCILVEVL